MPSVVIRPYVDGDEGRVLDLLAASLGKVVDHRYRALFRWKHLENPFGRSFMWVAEADGTIVGFRAFLRWRFVRGSDRVEAVRAVDTATDPDHRGGGIFRSLTMHGVDAMRDEGIGFVFNTPNDQSRPGYLKMGWEVVGRVPVQVRVRDLRALPRLWSARTAAALWSEPCPLGQPVGPLAALAAAGGSPGDSSAMATDRTAAFLTWRYDACPSVASRALRPSSRTAAVFRLRRRGRALECTVGDLFGPDVGAPAEALRASRANYALAGYGSHGRLHGFVRAPRIGPTLTWRPVALDAQPDLRLSLGDIELF